MIARLGFLLFFIFFFYFRPSLAILCWNGYGCGVFCPKIWSEAKKLNFSFKSVLNQFLNVVSNIVSIFELCVKYFNQFSNVVSNIPISGFRWTPGNFSSWQRKHLSDQCRSDFWLNARLLSDMIFVKYFTPVYFPKFINLLKSVYWFWMIFIFIFSHLTLSWAQT